jgi:apoptosis-inducing factor 3
MKKQLICQPHELPTVNTLRQFKSAEGMEVILCNDGGSIKAFAAQCPHLGLPLSKFGMVVNGTLICRAHNFDFCLETGKSKRVVPKCNSLTTYGVMVEDNNVFVILSNDTLILA